MAAAPPAYAAHYGETEAYIPPPGVSNNKQGLLSGVKNVLPGYNEIHAIKEELEGPKPLRVIAGLVGLALAFGSGIGLVNIFALLTKPAQFVLRVFETLFGCLIAIIELKSFFKPGNRIREFCYRWFPFLTMLAGKGAFYIFTGSMGLGFGMLNLLIFVPALLCIPMGIIYILFNFGRCNELREKYDQTIVYNNAGSNPYAPATPQQEY